jgi:hypothetical protein
METLSFLVVSIFFTCQDRKQKGKIKPYREEQRHEGVSVESRGGFAARVGMFAWGGGVCRGGRGFFFIFRQRKEKENSGEN